MMAVSVRPVDSGAGDPSWRVLISVPPGGFGRQLAIMRAWLDQNCGAGRWATAPAGRAGVVNDAITVYFADRAAAGAFIERFSCGYRAGRGSGYNRPATP